MKYLFLLLLTLPAFADVTLNDAYRREKLFLEAQKESLLKLKGGLKNSLVERKARAQKEIDAKQQELSALMLKNQELHEEFKALEKMTKENSQMSGQLEKNAVKISETFGALYSKLGLTQPKSDIQEPVKKFESILDEAFVLITHVSAPKWRSQAFLDENDHLVQGEVLFNGLFSAYGKLNGKTYSLVPYNNEFLKVAEAFGGKEIQMFTPNFERSGFKAAKSWKETTADAVPGIVMAMIMICVLGLFILLARA